MKKILTLAMALALIATCAFHLISCGGRDDVVGTYEMVSVSGTVTYNGQTVELSEDLYEYYRIILDRDGTAKIESKASNSTLKVEEEGTWEYEDGVLKVKSSPSGIAVVEEMKWENGTITYEAEQSGQGMTIKMTLVLQKQA